MNITDLSLEEIDELIAKIRKLPPATPIKLEVKSIKGRFFYNSTVSDKRYGSINTEKVDELISVINQQNLYLIAQLPAFRDYYYGLNNVPHGLHHSSGRYLWMDDAGCYWLNPASQGAITYLAHILTELKGLGFDEAVFSDFCFPDTTNILFNGDKAAASANAAKTLVTACSNDTFAVSFIGNTNFPLPEGRCRLYVENVPAADCESIAQQTGMEKPEINLVFIAQSHDTIMSGVIMLLVPGMILTVEPMINAGKRDIFVDAANEWTVYTSDRSLSAQWEHTILITENGPEILTY